MSPATDILRHQVFDLSTSERLIAKAISCSHQANALELIAELFEVLGEDAAFDFAVENEVAGHLGHCLADSESTVGDGRWWRIHEETGECISEYLDELDRMASILAANDIGLIALKNAGIARAIYPCSGCSPMGDIDVMVDKKDFRRAHRLLLDSGYEFKFRSPLEEASIEAAEAGGGGEYHIELRSGRGLWFELQWRPVAGRWIRPDQEPRAAELFDRSISVPGSKVRLLSPEDNLLQVALHTAKHTYVRAPGFRLHTDVDRIVCHQSIDWDLFRARVAAASVRTPVYFSLAIPALCMGTPIPPELLEELRPPGWKRQALVRWLDQAGLFGPNDAKFSRSRYLLFNALLYDSGLGLARAIFPDREVMNERYDIPSDWLLPVYHARRIFDLAARRMKT